MKEYEITLSGCDDVTSWTQTMTKEQFEFLSKIEKKSQKESTCNCMPVLEITPKEII